MLGSQARGVRGRGSSTCRPDPLDQDEVTRVSGPAVGSAKASRQAQPQPLAVSSSVTGNILKNARSDVVGGGVAAATSLCKDTRNRIGFEPSCGLWGSVA